MDLSIREYRPSDIGKLSDLWGEDFCYSYNFITNFFKMLPKMGTGLVAESRGELLGAVYILMGQTLILDLREAFTDDSSDPLCAYIYGLSVLKSSRNKAVGSALIKAASKKAKELGADIVCVYPRKASLYRWYEKRIGTKCVLYRKRDIILSSGLEQCIPLSSSEYMMWRENLLKDYPHLHLSGSCMEFERLLCADGGGGFYASGCGIAAAYRLGSRAVIVELLCSDSCEERIVAASVGSALGCRDVLLYRPSDRGEPYIAADNSLIPPDCVWNFSYD